MIDLLLFLVDGLFSSLIGFSKSGFDVLHHMMLTAGDGIDWLDQVVTGFVDKWAAGVIGEIYRLTDSYFLSRSGTLVGAARQIAAICVMFYLGYEMWPVILGRKAPDVLALLRPFLIAMILNAWPSFVTAMRAPGRTLETQGKLFFVAQWNKMGNLELECEKLQAQLNNKRDSVFALHWEELQGIKDAVMSYENYDTNHEDGESFGEWLENTLKDKLEGKWGTGWWLKIKQLWNAKDTAATMLSEVLKKFLDDAGQYISSWIEKILKWLSVLFLNFNFLGILMIGQIAMGVLAIFGPIMFAISITEVWHNAWAEWMMKFFSYSMYAFLAYLVMGFIYGLVFYELKDYNKNLTFALNSDWDGYTASFGRQFGRLVNWLVALWVGGYCMKFVPELAGIIFNVQGSGAAAGAADAMKGGVKSTMGVAGKIVGK